MNKKLALGMVGTVLTLLMSASITLASPITVTATVNSHLSATFNYDSVAYGPLETGSSNNAALHQTDGIYNVTIDTNRDFSVSASGSDFEDGAGHTFNIGNLTMDTDTDTAGLAVGNSIMLSGSPQVIDSNVAYTNTTDYHGFWLSIPGGQYAASYESTLTITYGNV